MFQCTLIIDNVLPSRCTTFWPKVMAYGLNAVRSVYRDRVPNISRLARPNSVNISILLYDQRLSHFSFFFLFFFLGNQIRNFHLRRSFWPKNQDLLSNKVVLICILRTLLIKSMRAICDPSWAGRLFPAPRVPSQTALIQGFSQFLQ